MDNKQQSYLTEYGLEIFSLKGWSTLKSTKDSSEIKPSLEREFINSQMVLFIMVSSITICSMDREFITMRMEISMKGDLCLGWNQGLASINTLLGMSMMVNIKRISNQERENSFLSTGISMLDSFKKTLFMGMESISLIKINSLLGHGIMENSFKTIWQNKH